jgi:hypothetical protein
MTAWLIGLGDRPIAERERRGALVASVAVLIATAVLLALTRPAPHHSPIRHAIAASSTTLAADPSPLTPDAPTDGTLSPAAGIVSRAFLGGYLAYAYGRAPAGRITDATRALIVSLAARPPRVSPGMRARQPRIVELHAAPAPSGLLGVSAIVNDGGLIGYSLGLFLEPNGRRLLVTALGQD